MIPGLEPETQRFLDRCMALSGPPLYQLGVNRAREVFASLQAAPVDVPPTEIEDLTLPLGPTKSVSVRIIRPRGMVGLLPVVMYFHGGGWVLGDKGTHNRLVCEIACGTGAAVVFVDYDRAAEAKFPVANEQAYAVTKYVASGRELNLDGTRLAVAGDSAGGNMATVVALLANERGGPKLAYQVLFYPATDTSLDTPSHRQFADGPWLIRDAMLWFWEAYMPAGVDRFKPTVAPLRASREQLQGLPPALIITAEFDVLRDEGEAYGRSLAEAGVRVTSVRYNGTFHDFVMADGLRNTPAARAATAQAISQLRGALAHA